jgi:hypothetical protein
MKQSVLLNVKTPSLSSFPWALSNNFCYRRLKFYLPRLHGPKGHRPDSLHVTKELVLLT